MARTRLVTDVSTGQQTVVPYTPQEEADADAAKAADDIAQAPLVAQQQRIAAIKANARRIALVTAIQNSDDAQLITFLTNNITDLPTARTQIINLALLVAAVIRS